MAVSPSGILSNTRAAVATALSQCAEFQSLVGAADAAEALLSIYHHGLPDPANGASEYTDAELTSYRPNAILYTDEDQGCQTVYEAQGGSFEAMIHVGIELIRDVTKTVGDAPSADANVEWDNIVGTIIEELWVESAAAEVIDFAAINLERGPTWAARDEYPGRGPTQLAMLMCTCRG